MNYVSIRKIRLCLLSICFLFIFIGVSFAQENNPAPVTPTPAPVTPTPAPVTPTPAAPVISKAENVNDNKTPVSDEVKTLPKPSANNEAQENTSDDPIELLNKATDAYLNGEYNMALEAIWSVEEKIWNMAPLMVKNVAFITEPATSSSYTLKDGETFTANEPIFLYFEPIGYTQKKNGENYNASMNVSFNVLDGEANVLGGQANLGPYEIKSEKNFTTSYFINMTISMKNLNPGDYTLAITINDNLKSEKNVQFSKDFIIN